jgi:hypothetical protein
MELDPVMYERLETVRKSMGMKHNTNVVAALLSEEYDKIQAEKYKIIPVDKSTYEALKERARELGVTPDTYASAIILEHMTDQGPLSKSLDEPSSFAPSKKENK